MSAPLIDYYVGLLRGYLLAHNAPQQILHALEELLTHYRTKAGPLIGEQEAVSVAGMRLPTAKEMGERILELAQNPEVRNHSEPSVPASLFWTKKQLQDLRDNYATMRMGELVTLIGRDKVSIRNKAASLGLKKATKEPEEA